MTARIIGGLLYELDDGPVDTRLGVGFEGRVTQHLILGDEHGGSTLTVSLATTSIERIEEAISSLQYIRDAKIRQQRLANLPEVA